MHSTIRPEANPDGMWVLEIFSYDFDKGEQVIIDSLPSDNLEDMLSYADKMVDWSTVFYRVRQNQR